MRHSLAAVALALTSLGAGESRAEPILQLYLEGGTYDAATQTWVLTPPGSSGGAPFRLWTIANLSGPGGKGTVFDVRLSVGYDASYGDLTIVLTPARAGGDGDYTGSAPHSATFHDPLPTPIQPGLQTTINTSLGVVTSPTGLVTNGGRPVLSDGKLLPWHDEFGPGTYWKEFALGDFDTADSEIGDFIGSFPLAAGVTPNSAHINVYEVSVTGSPTASGAHLHFDLYNHIEAGDRAKFAPFSHDADGTAHIAPAPSSLVGLLSMALAAGLALAWRRRKAKR